MKNKKGSVLIELLLVLFGIFGLWMIAYALFPDQVLLIYTNKPHIIALFSLTIIALFFFRPKRRR